MKPVWLAQRGRQESFLDPFLYFKVCFGVFPCVYYDFLSKMCISSCVYDDRAIRFSQVFEVRLFRMFPINRKSMARGRCGRREKWSRESRDRNRHRTEQDSVGAERKRERERERERECTVVPGLSERERESCFKGWQHTEELETNRAPRT